MNISECLKSQTHTGVFRRLLAGLLSMCFIFFPFNVPVLGGKFRGESQEGAWLCSWPRCYMFVVLGNSSSSPPKMSQPALRFIFKSSITQTLQPSYGRLAISLLPSALHTFGLKGLPALPSSNNDNLLSAINLQAGGVVFHVLSCSSIWSCLSIFSPISSSTPASAHPPHA